MAEIKDDNNENYLFFTTDKYLIGTPNSIDSSDRTLDIKFNDFINDGGLQEKLNLASSPYAGTAKARVSTSSYLLSFTNPKEREKRQTYLMNNGLVRILITDDDLRKEIFLPK